MILTMTSDLFRHAHRLMWLELERTGSSNKNETQIMMALKKMSRSHDLSMSLHEAIKYSCFACGYACSKNPYGYYCNQCPLFDNSAGRIIDFCLVPLTPYWTWENAITKQERQHWAGVIARMEWRG
jgi:hypothetical protein